MLEKMKQEKVRLEAEFKKGQQMLAKLQQKANTLTTNMQRIQGAVQFINGQIAEDEKQEVPCENIGDPTSETQDELE